MSDWVEVLTGLARRDESAVLVSVAETTGSTPREAGARMVVTAATCSGTVGGGTLEHRAIDVARRLLAGTGGRARVQRYALGPSLAQCCGGVVVLLFEIVDGRHAGWLARLAELRGCDEPVALATVIDGEGDVHKLVITAADCFGHLAEELLQTGILDRARRLLSDDAGDRAHAFLSESSGPTVFLERWRQGSFNIVVFGAGHVGRALIAVLAGLPCRITWVDGRSEQFPRDPPDNVSVLVSEAPCYEVAQAAPGSYFLVMTHSHALDQEITERVLRRGDFRYCGLIGSRAKRLKFEKRLRAAGVPDRALCRLICPIGASGISGKQPAEIAVAVAAQLLQTREAHPAQGVGEPPNPTPVVDRGRNRHAS